MEAFAFFSDGESYFWLSYKKDHHFSTAISAYNITSLSKAINANKSNVICFMLPPTCDVHCVFIHEQIQWIS